MSKIALITEKLKDVLSADDLTQIQETIEVMVQESVEAKVEAETKRVELLAEEYVEKQIAEGMEAKTAELIAEYDAKLDELESEIVENLDKFLDMEISEKISDDMLKKIAINETYEPIIEGIKNLFENQFIDLDVEGAKVLMAKDEKISELEESAATHIAEKLELNETIDALKKDLLISEKVQDLTESEKARVLKFTESRSLAELTEGIDEIVSVVTESKSVAKTDEVIQENIDEDDGIEAEELGTPEAEIEKDELNESVYSQADGLMD